MIVLARHVNKDKNSTISVKRQNLLNQKTNPSAARRAVQVPGGTCFFIINFFFSPLRDFFFSL